MYFKQIFNKDYLMEYLSNIKLYFLISLVIFIISFILGYVLAEVFQSEGLELLKQIVSQLPDGSISATYLFKNNMTVAVIIMLGGFLFSITSILTLLVNGFLIGFTFWILNDPLKFILLVAPHGIFELTAIILSFAVSLMITHVICKLIRGIFYKDSSLKNEYYNSRGLIRNILLSIFVIILLLLVAAFIEAYLTVPLANFFIGPI